MRTGRRAVFLDRDGVINVRLPDLRYVTRREEFTFLDGIFEALRNLQAAGFLLIVVTNQRGIARGLMTEDDLRDVHSFMNERLGREGIALDDIRYCPHDRDEGCECRKPMPGMIEAACADHDIDREGSVIIGDSISDMEAGAAAGVPGIYLGSEAGELPPGTLRAGSLSEAVSLFMDRSSGEAE